MSVCTRKSDGQIFVQWMEGGKTRRKYFGSGIEAKAAATAFNVTVAKPQGSNGDDGGPLFLELANAYMVHKSPPTMSRNCFRNLAWKLEGTILPILGETRASQLNHYIIDRYIAARAKLKVKMTSIHRELSDVKAILNWAVRRGLIDRSPMAGYKMPTRDDAIILPPTQDEIERIISNSPPHLQRAMLMSFFLGLRPGAVELLAIRYSQIDWQACTLTVISANKGGIDRREVPIHSSMPIRTWFEEDGFDQDRHVITWRGRPIKTLKRSWATAKRKAGISGRKLTLYSIRHAFVTTLLHLGIDIHTIANISGHDVHTMLKHYAHAMDNAKKAAVESLPPLKITAPTSAVRQNGTKENKQ